ncbi:MAG: hypothetical protein EWV80_18775 [Microcystis aeruginosa Ma_QC_B_20070730_S2]|uniref:Uncharacterized protein n=1 Tax=Microcystis aeruginosa Ma_QC_B_20070730_S2 TaxID=2486256 RepID=A0A552DBY2_MICAE|nr:MAG: hypothetical protein EWV80_18775 [Microcystis aeruginosa Ma_QC_B_20070730_S2]
MRNSVPFGRTQFAPTLWTKSVTVGAQSLRPPIDWDIIPTQVPKFLASGRTQVNLCPFFLAAFLKIRLSPKIRTKLK